MAYDPWAYTSPCGVLNGGVLISEVGLLATLRLRGTSGRDGCQVQKKKEKSALWDCFGGRIFNMAANLSPKIVPQCALTTISTRSSAQLQSGE